MMDTHAELAAFLRTLAAAVERADIRQWDTRLDFETAEVPNHFMRQLRHTGVQTLTVRITAVAGTLREYSAPAQIFSAPRALPPPDALNKEPRK